MQGYMQRAWEEIQHAPNERKIAIIAEVCRCAYEKSLPQTADDKKIASEFVAYVRDAVMLPALRTNNLQSELLSLAILVEYYSLQKISVPEMDAMLVKLTKVYAGMADSHMKYVVNAVIYLLESLQMHPKKAQRQFITRLVSTRSVFASMQEFEHAKAMMVRIFPDPGLLVEIMNDVAYKGKFDSFSYVQKQDAILWTVSVLWNMYVHEKHFIAIYESWKKILRKAMDRKDDELVFFMHFPLSHIFLNLAQTQDDFRQFNREVEEPFSAYMQEYCRRKGILPVDRKLTAPPKKIGILLDRVVMNSPGKILLSFLIGLKESGAQYDITIYDLEYIEKSVSDAKMVETFKRMGFGYVSNHALIDDAHEGQYYSHQNKCLKLREKIVQDAPDMMIMYGNSREQFNFLYTSRVAPVQLFWSHGNYVYDIPGIDIRMAHAGASVHSITRQAIEGFDYLLMRISMPEEAYNPPVPEDMLQRVRERFPQGKTVLGYIGRLIKMANREYLETVMQIMQENPDTIFIACGIGAMDDIVSVVREYNMQDRFFFPGMVNPHLFGQVIDLIPNTFPLTMGEAAEEFRAKSKVVVTFARPLGLQVETMRQETYAVGKSLEHLAPELAENIRKTTDMMELFFCDTLEDYKHAVNRLIREPDLRKELGDSIGYQQRMMMCSPLFMVNQFAELQQTIWQEMKEA